MKATCVIGKLARLLQEIDRIHPNSAAAADYLQEARKMIESAMWEENEAENG